MTAFPISPWPEIVAIGTSTGGPGALQKIIPQLPGDLPAAIIVVQHMPAGFTAPLAKRLNSLSRLKVKEAEHGEVVEAATVYIAPAGHHLVVQRRRGPRPTLALLKNPADTPHKPSVDVMMLSVAEVFGPNCVGVILTGMGNDGLAGMTAIHQARGTTIGQDEATSVVYGMPRVCFEHGVLKKIIPLFQIPRAIELAVGYAEKLWEVRKPSLAERVESKTEAPKQI